MKLSKRTIAFVSVDDSALLSEDSAVVHNVSSAELIANTRPAYDLDVSGEAPLSACVVRVVGKPDGGHVRIVREDGRGTAA